MYSCMYYQTLHVYFCTCKHALGHDFVSLYIVAAHVHLTMCFGQRNTQMYACV